MCKFCQASLYSISLISVPPAGVDAYGQKYVYFTESVKWEAANAACRSLGAGWNLASFRSLEQETAVYDGLQRPCTRYWIGLTSTSGQWAWTDGSDFTYSSFLSGVPSNSGSYGANQLFGWGCGPGKWCAGWLVGGERMPSSHVTVAAVRLARRPQPKHMGCDHV